MASMPLMRPFTMIIAVLALLLAFGPEPHAHAGGADIGAVLSTHRDADGCASSAMAQTERHDAGNCGNTHCCLGAICGFAGLPAASVLARPASATTVDLSAATAALTGRDVAPPFDPPRPLA